MTPRWIVWAGPSGELRPLDEFPTPHEAIWYARGCRKPGRQVYVKRDGGEPRVVREWVIEPRLLP